MALPMQFQTGEVDDTLTMYVETVLFEATSNCNLRCTYCRVSAPSYVGEDFEFSRLERLADQMVAANVRNVQISGHGETTMLPHWEHHCRCFFDRGIGVRITSNFARVFTDAEIDVLARMQEVTISIDTIDRSVLRNIRRHVDLRTVLYNMQRVRLANAIQNGHQPLFNWQCTLSDHVVFGLPAWVEMGLLNGVGKFTLGNLIEHKDLPDILAKEKAPLVRHVARMARDSLIEACASIRIAVERARRSGATFVIQPGIVQGINKSLQEFGTDDRLGFSAASLAPNMDQDAGSLPAVAALANAERAAAAAPDVRVERLDHDIDEGQSQTVNSKPVAGETRDCLDPWTQPFLRANGDLWPCPWFYSPLGNVQREPFDGIMNGAPMRKLRQELLSGDLRDACTQCPSRGITTPRQLLVRLNEATKRERPTLGKLRKLRDDLSTYWHGR